MKSKGTLSRLLGYIKPNLPFLLLALLFSVIQITATLLAPVVIGRAIDYIIAENNVNFTMD